MLVNTWPPPQPQPASVTNSRPARYNLRDQSVRNHVANMTCPHRSHVFDPCLNSGQILGRDVGFPSNLTHSHIHFLSKRPKRWSGNSCLRHSNTEPLLLENGKPVTRLACPNRVPLAKVVAFPLWNRPVTGKNQLRHPWMKPAAWSWRRR